MIVLVVVFSLALVGVLAAWWYEWEALGVTSIAVGIVSGAILLGLWVMTTGCARYERIVGTETHFDPFAGCFVDIGDQMVPIDENSIGLILGELRKDR